MTFTRAGLTGVALAAIAGCAIFDNSAVSELESTMINEKIELQIPFDKWELTAQHKTELAEFLKNLRTATNTRSSVTFSAVVVTGHTDRIGPLSYNMTVSERLASAAKDYLVEAEHVDPSLIFWEGSGPNRPIPVTEFCDKKMKVKQLIDCLSPNRRVTIEVIGTAVPQPKFTANRAVQHAAAQ